jgi:nickel/cobalt transporter (NicO) family protein
MRFGRMRIGRAGAGCVAAGVIAFLLLGAPVANAHPLGNFSVNHSHTLHVTPDGVADRAVVDFAEIPTTQASRTVDADGDGETSVAELQQYGQTTCAAVGAAATLSIDSNAVVFRVISASFAYQPGQAGLLTSRLECDLHAAVDLTDAHSVSFHDVFESDRVGWHEIIAVGDGMSLIGSPVPAVSGTDTLRTYPTDLLASPLDVREVVLSVGPSTGYAPAATRVATPSNSGTSLLHGGPFADVVDRITREFDGLVGRRDLTLGVGLLAVSLAMILGMSHALLPGHGKTVMAAYIAGRQGSSRDAVIVGATVTATHTGGVLLLGLALTLSTALAGEVVLAWLGTASGLLIAGLGISLLIGAIRHRPIAHGHRHGLGGHTHGPAGHTHGHDHPHGDHGHLHGGSTDFGARPELLIPESRRMQLSAVAVLDRERPAPARPALTLVPPDVSHVAQMPARAPFKPVSRRGLIGMGIAGGLVPSPSALIVLLSAIALGRTAFGVLLVVGYGLGMAATLTLAGLFLVRVRDRYQDRQVTGGGRIASFARRWAAVIPYSTAALVMVVGVGLAARSVGSL